MRININYSAFLIYMTTSLRNGIETAAPCLDTVMDAAFDAIISASETDVFLAISARK